jgi:hypothetical protein
MGFMANVYYGWDSQFGTFCDFQIDFFPQLV